MLHIVKLAPLFINYWRFFPIIGSLLLWVGVAWSKVDQCMNCHQDLHPEIVQLFREDIHYSRGLSCSDCHGGNPDIPDESGMDKKYGFRGTPATAEVPEFCARCHSNTAYMRPFNPSLPTDQLDKYWTSHHGIGLKRGDKSVATCVSCHGSHHILPGSDPRSMVYPGNVAKTCGHCHSDEKLMSAYGIPIYQYAQYTDSANVHGYALYIKGDLSAPTCNDCHGNHGAAPPKVEQVAQVCTQCHSQNGEYFRRSPHKEAFDALGIMECAFCHQKDPDINHPTARIHTIIKPDYKMMSPGSSGICGQCHSDGDEGMSVASLVYGVLDSLYKKLHRTEE
ncbi:MAG: cytochrome c3 family protein, partial [bacterium]